MNMNINNNFTQNKMDMPLNTMMPSLNYNTLSMKHENNFNNLSTNIIKQTVNNGLAITQGNVNNLLLTNNNIANSIKSENHKHFNMKQYSTQNNYYNNNDNESTWLTQISQQHGFNDLESQYVVN